MKSNYLKKNGFSYIELLIALSILAVCLIPLTHMFSDSIGQLALTGDSGTALSLARLGMAKARSLSEAELNALGTVTEPPLTIDGVNWIIKREIINGTDPVEVYIKVLRNNNSVVELATLIEDIP